MIEIKNREITLLISLSIVFVAVAITTPIAPIPPVIKPTVRPKRRPKRCESLPTIKAAPADPSVNKAAGSPENASVPSICCARSALR